MRTNLFELALGALGTLDRRLHRRGTRAAAAAGGAGDRRRGGALVVLATGRCARLARLAVVGLETLELLL